MFSFFKKKVAAPTPTPPQFQPTQIVPRIKHLNFLEALKPLMAQVEQSGGDPKMQMAVTRPFVGDLLVTYSLDLPDRFVSISHQVMQEMGLDPDSLHRIALENLEKCFNEGIAVQDLQLYNAIGTGGNLEACTLLLPWLWQKKSTTVTGDLLMVVPSRNAVYFTGSEHQLKLDNTVVTSKHILGIMCSAALQVKADEQVHGLSDHVFVWRNGWQVVDAMNNLARSE
jgi:hypothetical protein